MFTIVFHDLFDFITFFTLVKFNSTFSAHPSQIKKNVWLKNDTNALVTSNKRSEALNKHIPNSQKLCILFTY